MDDFAGVTFEATTNVTKKRKGNDENEKGQKQPQKKESSDEEQVTKKHEIIPGVTADMVKPFNPKEWTPAMKEDFRRLASHDYEQNDEEIEMKMEMLLKTSQRQILALCQKKKAKN